MLDGPEFTERLADAPGGAPVLRALERHGRARLVGGAVRDILLGLQPREFDVVVSDDAHGFAGLIGDVESEHERFGTLRTSVDGVRVDVARARTEVYAAPGALPTVEFSDFEADLARRDFTINAISAGPAGDLQYAGGALDDLAARRIAVLHANSFIDDPTRLWRMVRYSTRLGFEIADETARLATDAIEGGALATVSSERHTAELRLLLDEVDVVPALTQAASLGLIDDVDCHTSAVRDAAELALGRAHPGMAALGAAMQGQGVLAAFSWTVAERAVLDACTRAVPLPTVPPNTPSMVAAVARRLPAEAVAVAGARGSAAAAEHWFEQWAHVRPTITGDDLTRSGMAEGPAVGEALAALSAGLLDGQVTPGRDSELAWAVEHAGQA